MLRTASFDPIAPEFYAGKIVMVTGGRGFLGRSVCAALRASGARVVALGRADGDLTEQADVRRLFEAHEPAVVIHLAAACGGIGANVANPGRFLYANATMGLAVLEAARRAEVEVFTLISTTCAYPRTAPIPLREETIWDGAPTGATGPYGLAKRLLHEAIIQYNRQYGLSGITLIPANLYGPEDHFDPENSHVVAALVRRYVEAAATAAPKVVNWGSGRPTREFLHVRDAARGIVMATARHRDPQPVNLGTGVETSIADLAQMIADAAGYRGQIEWDRTRPDGQPRRSLDVSRARAFGFAAQVPLTAGLAETVQWYRAHPA